jgi:glucoamylase
MDAPGYPGIPPTWTSSAKDLTGTSLGQARLWFTLGHGIVNEVYWPRVDLPQVRDLGFIVGDGDGFWCEVKRLGSYAVRTPEPGLPVAEVVHRHERFALTLRIAPDPERDVLLVEVALDGDLTLLPYALLAPHLGGSGYHNTARIAGARGHTVLAADQGPFGLALCAVDPDQRDAWMRASAGYVGFSDGWQDFHRNGAMTWRHPSAGPGNVALMGQLPRRCVLALAFGGSHESAATLAVSALVQDFGEVWQANLAAWRAWLAPCAAREAELPAEFRDPWRVSAIVLKTHQDKTYAGAMVASLSIPWGNSKDDIGGYHLVWPRDLVQGALALIAIGAVEDARDILRYLIATQLADGRWQQNQWLGGTPHWGGVQLDEVAFPVLLASALAERDALDGIRVADMVRRALGYLMLNGPATDQDRWEEIAGLNPYTLAACIAALVCGAELLADPLREDALQVADDWNASVERWTVAAGGALGARFGVGAHYVRTAPPRILADPAAIHDPIELKNRGHGAAFPASDIVSTDFLQLVRNGLRAADDPVVRDTLGLVDALLRYETPAGPVWYRYNHDGYGEHDDGAPYDGAGRGRPWPLLAGERGHYALAAGEDAAPYLCAMVGASGNGGLMPEQVWDAAPIPQLRLFPGRPSGAAMPLVWAHAEFVKLLASRARGAPVDRPEPVWRRYGGVRPAAPERAHWSRRAPVGCIGAGRRLRLLLAAPAIVHWSADGWAAVADTPTRASGFGLEVAELPTRGLAPGAVVRFTLRDARSGAWEGRDYVVRIG